MARIFGKPEMSVMCNVFTKTGKGSVQMLPYAISTEEVYFAMMEMIYYSVGSVGEPKT